MPRTVKLKKEIFSGIIDEVFIPFGCFKEKIFDNQDTKPYFKYFYISKKGIKKECKIKWI